jgi:hypothetical protein
MTLEILRFNWKPSVIRLLLAAAVDAGPVAAQTWARRSGVPRNHLLPAVREAERLGALAVEPLPEGLRLLVQRVEMWRERPECSAEEFSRAWGRAVEQLRMQLATEMPGLGEALAAIPESGGAQNRNPVTLPESGGLRTKVSTLNVQRSPLSGKGSSKALNVERLTEGTGIRWDQWEPPETEADALDACRLVLGDSEEERAREMVNWGGRWRMRWRREPEKMRRILAAVVEDRKRGFVPDKTWGAHASDLWERFV